MSQNDARTFAQRRGRDNPGLNCKLCSFTTDRLVVGEWRALSVNDEDMVNAVATILTPRVTQSLPEAWRGEYSHHRASKWLEETDQHAATLLILDRASGKSIGLMILFENVEERSVRIGYMLAESAWGSGYATELLQGFVGWCKKMDVALVIGGVDQDNVASQRVMEKNGFGIAGNSQSHGQLIYELQLE